MIRARRHSSSSASRSTITSSPSPGAPLAASSCANTVRQRCPETAGPSGTEPEPELGVSITFADQDDPAVRDRFIRALVALLDDPEPEVP